MEKFALGFVYMDGYFDFTVNTDYVFNAETNKDAIEKVASVEGKISRCIKVCFDRGKKDIIVDVLDNEYFGKATPTGFTFYDKTKAYYKKLDLDNGKSLYPVQNEKCFVDCSNESFIELLQQHYKSYLKDHKVLAFEPVAFSVELLIR